jgi:hypothetical protein
MAPAGDIRAQVALESERRRRLSVPALAGGVLFLFGSITIETTLKGAPTVGLLQGLRPALSGVANPAVSPRTAEVKFVSHHAFALISGSVLAALGIGALTLVLLLMLDATRFRRPQTWSAARPLVLGGGIAFAVVSIGHQIASAIGTHKFAVGHDFSSHAVDQALTKGAVNVTVQYIAFLAGLALAAGMIAVMLNALRVGLLPRWVAVLGMLTAVLIFFPLGGTVLGVIPAFWLVVMGILFSGRWPKPGEPLAWSTGEPRPWPSAAERRAERGQDAQGRRRPVAAPQPAVSAAGADLPGAAGTGTGASRKRRRKRGRRG